MDLFFAYNHITRSEVKIVEMNAPTMVKSIESGHIDAMFCWQPWVLKAKNALGSNGLILPNEHIHIGSWVIIAMKQFADQHPEIMEKFVKAVVKKIAELYGWKVWVESEQGEGSTFFFTLLKG